MPNEHLPLEAQDRIEALKARIVELEATIGCIGIGTDADECAKKWMVAAQLMADDRERYREALKTLVEEVDNLSGGGHTALWFALKSAKQALNP